MIEFLKQTFGDAATDDVITQFKSELGRKFVAKADYNTKRDELKNARERLEEMEAQAEVLRTRAADADRLSEDLSTLQSRYDEHITALNGKLEQVKTENEISSLIRKYGGRNEKAVRALISISDDNPMGDITEQLDTIKRSDPYLFDMPAPGGTKGNFPRNDSAPKGTLTYSQMMQLEGNK